MAKKNIKELPGVVWMSVDNLLFDPDNPRLPDTIDGSDDIAVLEWMLRQGDSIELISSIGATGYSIAEPLLVTESKRNKGAYVVVEGNRRLTALKLLLNPALAPIKQKAVEEAVSNASTHPETVPVIIYEKREDAFAYLGYRHIAGTKAWGPLQKAKYIKQLIEYYKKSGLDEANALKKIATVAATTAYNAKKVLTTLALYEHAKEAGYWNIQHISSGNIDFSVLGTALNHNAIVSFIGLEASTDYTLSNIEQSKTAELFQWLFAKEKGDKSRVGESRQLSTLAKVVSTPQALEAFRAGRTLQDAAIYTDEIDEIFQALMNKALTAIDQIEPLLGRVTPSDVNMDMLRDLQSAVKRAGFALKEKLTNQSDEF